MKRPVFIAIFIAVFISLILFSCKDTNKSKEQELLRREQELLKKEQELNKRLELEKAKKKAKLPINVKKETEKLFNKTTPRIEKSKAVTISNSEIIIGDLNDDGLDDAIVFYYVTPVAEGNINIGTEMAIYLNKENKMKLVTDFAPDYLFFDVEIKNNVIHIIRYDYAEDDVINQPSIAIDKYFILDDDELIESKVY